MAKKRAGKVVKEDRAIVFEFTEVDPKDFPLNEHAEELLKALRNAGHALSWRQLQKLTNIPSGEFSSATAVLMVHGLIEPDCCRRRGRIWRIPGQPNDPPKVPHAPTARPCRAKLDENDLFGKLDD